MHTYWLEEILILSVNHQHSHCWSLCNCIWCSLSWKYFIVIPVGEYLLNDFCSHEGLSSQSPYGEYLLFIVSEKSSAKVSLSLLMENIYRSALICRKSFLVSLSPLSENIYLSAGNAIGMRMNWSQSPFGEYLLIGTSKADYKHRIYIRSQSPFGEYLQGFKVHSNC